MNSKEIRQKYLGFFEKRGHAVLPSTSLVPENDPSVLFNTAGMQPLVPFTAYLIEFCREWNNKNSLKLLGIIILMGAISTHYFIISILLTTFVLAINFAYHVRAK